jgi:hypothetical protein
MKLFGQQTVKTRHLSFEKQHPEAQHNHGYPENTGPEACVPCKLSCHVRLPVYVVALRCDRVMDGVP